MSTNKAWIRVELLQICLDKKFQEILNLLSKKSLTALSILKVLQIFKILKKLRKLSITMIFLSKAIPLQGKSKLIWFLKAKTSLLLETVGLKREEIYQI